jgi:hypothetical protein
MREILGLGFSTGLSQHVIARWGYRSGVKISGYCPAA